jgi:hypothetical protein
VPERVPGPPLIVLRASCTDVVDELTTLPPASSTETVMLGRVEPPVALAGG